MRKIVFLFAVLSVFFLWGVVGCNALNIKQSDYEVNKPWMEETLRKSVQQYRTMMENLPDGVQPNSINKNGVGIGA